MKRYTDNSRIYEGTRMSFFFIEGDADAELNRYIEERHDELMRRFDCECEFRIIKPLADEISFVKNLMLRRNPMLSEQELNKKIEAIGKRGAKNSRSKLIYINDVKQNSYGEHEADIICEEEFGKDFEQKVEAFFSEVQLCRCQLFIIPDRSVATLSGYNYKLPETEGIEEDALLGEDNIECICNELLTENICGEESVTEEISPIRFDSEFNISLPLYPQIVITLEPLPKSLYILFLQHPEGIILKEIQDYEQELKNIYSVVSGRKNPTVIERMFRTLVDPTEAPLHKNLSIIRRSFTSKLSYEIAKNYIPSHSRAKAHNIPLDAELVELPEIA